MATQPTTRETSQPETIYGHIAKNPRVCGGSACIDHTRIRVIDIVLAHKQGKKAEDIKDLFGASLTLGQIYSALGYAEDHADEIAADFAEHARIGEQGEFDRAEFLEKLEEEQPRR